VRMSRVFADGLDLFDAVCNRWFAEAATTIVLVLNKRDRLERRLARMQLSTVFPNFTSYVVKCDFVVVVLLLLLWLEGRR